MAIQSRLDSNVFHLIAYNASPFEMGTINEDIDDIALMKFMHTKIDMRKIRLDVQDVIQTLCIAAEIDQPCGTCEFLCLQTGSKSSAASQPPKHIPPSS